MDMICSSRFAWLLRNGNAMSRFYMVQFSIASTTQSTAHIASSPTQSATVVLDEEVPPKKSSPIRSGGSTVPTHRPTLVQTGTESSNFKTHTRAIPPDHGVLTELVRRRHEPTCLPKRSASHINGPRSKLSLAPAAR